MIPAAQRPAPAARSQRVAELLAIVGLDGFQRRRVTELSGGEAKRVALARSLAPSPRVLLLDEPLTGLDRELHDRLAGELATILRATGTTSLLVTHDAAEAATVADRVETMADLGGAVEIVELTAEETRPLRAAVLRRGTPTTNVVWAGDDDPVTVHLGARRTRRHRRRVVVDAEAVPRHRRRSGGAAARDGRRPRHAGPWRRRGAAAARACSGPSPEAPTPCGPTPATRRWTSTAGTASRSSATASSTKDTGLPHHRIRVFPFRAPPTPRRGEAVRHARRSTVPSDPHADELRRRAGELRRLASRLGAVPLADLDGWAGPDTWSSPGADECRVDGRPRPPARRPCRRRAARAGLGAGAPGRRRSTPSRRRHASLRRCADMGTYLAYDPVRLITLRAAPRPPSMRSRAVRATTRRRPARWSSPAPRWPTSKRRGCH